MIATSTNITVRLQKHIPGDAQAVAIFLCEDAKGSDEGLAPFGGTDRAMIRKLVQAKHARGKAGEIIDQFVDAGHGKLHRLVLVGMGSAKKLEPETVRQAAGRLAKACRKWRAESVAIIPPIIGKAPQAGAAVSGFLLASFRFEQYKGKVSREKDDQDGIKSVQLTIVGGRELRDEIDHARIIADAQNIARTISSRPGNDINPPSLAKLAQKMASELKLGVKVLNERQMQRLGMGGILAVGSASATPPRMIAVEYKPRHARGSKPLLIVGKSITFDAGGISIKPADKMDRMIYDKSGGAIVLGILYAVARLRVPVHVVGILSAAENTLSGRGYRPGDILRMYNGVTVEVTNTDAEGRLVLGDALAWGIETYKPAAVVDLATLTGGVVVALGKTMAGIMGNDDELAGDIQRAADAAGEKIWRLPIGDDQREQMKSDVADIINSANREASPLQGGAFLSYFIPDEPHVPWAHLDIAGVSDMEKETPYYSKGATGWGVRTLVDWIASRR